MLEAPEKSRSRQDVKTPSKGLGERQVVSLIVRGFLNVPRERVPPARLGGTAENFNSDDADHGGPRSGHVPSGP